ncbi:GNAT family N-acetyltransferase [uncultured Brevundimonas sp.]|uniref:GNAT family N-acetyltransferase n=1 Tax=uncultured Brevundimonas sp. TaxID=213418 RepID=UPI0030EEC494
MTAARQDPASLAAIHAEAFESAWSEAAIADLLDQAGVIAVSRPGGFILVRVVADEAEILTLAVAPGSRRAGLGLWLTEQGAQMAAAAGARRLFLEVAADNVAARTLYARAGFAVAGQRPGYYARKESPAVDALLLSLNIPRSLPIP